MRAALLVLLGVQSAFLVGGCNSGSREPAVSGPYVQAVTSQSAIVAAVTDAPTQLRVRLDGIAANGSGSVEDPDPLQVHGLRFVGLQADTTYTYQLESLSGQALGNGQFRTAPARDDAPCTFLVVGDTGGTDESQGELIDEGRKVIDDLRGATGDENQQGAVAAAMLGRGADLIVHTGDVVYPAGARSGYAKGFFEPFAPLIRDVPIFPTLGNHDLKTEGGAPFLETFFTPTNGPKPDGRAYSFDWGVVHFVCLDVVSTEFKTGSEQARWLARDLAASQARWKVVYFHVPAYSPRGRGSPEIREHLVPLFEAGGVDLALSGHDHAYARYLPRGRTTYLVSGGGGKSLYALASDDVATLAYGESVFHFVEVKATRAQLEIRAIDASGNAFDAVTVAKR